MFDKIDNIFLSIMLKYKKIFEDVIQQSKVYNINLTKEHINLQKQTVEITNVRNKKTSTHKVICFCIYDTKQELFRWMNGFNHMLFGSKDFQDMIVRWFGTRQTTDKIFKNNEFNINKKLHYSIVYFIAILYGTYNVIRFTSENEQYIMYALLDLGIKDNFDLKKLEKDIQPYLKACKVNKKNK
jgi:hypothetical protein